MRKYLFQPGLPLISFSILISSICFAQVSEEWIRRYNGPANRIDNIRALVVDDSKNVYVTGDSRSIGGYSDYATIKYSGTGAQLWLARYNGPSSRFDDATSIAIDDLGNVYVTGASNGIDPDLDNQDYATIKYDKNGVQQWVARYNGPDNRSDVATAIAVDFARNVYVTGYSMTAMFSYDYITIKYNKDGVQQWVARYNGPGKHADQAFDLVIDPSNNIFVTGLSYGVGTTTDVATIKYSPAGTVLWVSRYDGPTHGCEHGTDLALDVTGTYVYVAGGTGTCAAFSGDYATLKYNAATGVLLWIATYNGPDSRSDDASALAVDAGGNVYVTGSSLNAAGFDVDYDYATVKYNSAGVQLWSVRYGGVGAGSSDRASSLALDGSANVYVTGASASVGTLSDIATIKYNTAGTNLWITRYNGPASRSDGGQKIFVDGAGKVYVGGSSEGIGTETDFTTIKYTQTAAKMIDKPSDLIGRTPLDFNVSGFPNPVSSIARIQYELPFDGRVAIKLYDILGREVATLLNADKAAGYYNTEFNVSSLQKGVYYYKASLLAGEKIVTQSGKMIVIK